MSSQVHMTPRQAIESALATGRLTRDCLEPPMTVDERIAFGAQVGGSLPEEIDGLFALCRGLHKPKAEDGVLDFTGGAGRLYRDAVADGLEATGKFEAAAISAIRGTNFFEHQRIGRSACLGFDACGNYWSVEIGSDGRWGPVWFLCHDPPVWSIAAADLGGFLDEGFTRSEAELNGSWPTGDDNAIWRRNPFATAAESCFASADAEVGDFARQVGVGWDVFDLREGRPGTGIPWGRYGDPDDDVRKHPRLRIFAAKRPPPRRSFWSRLFGMSGR
jgi:hypothetical protein